MARATRSQSKRDRQEGGGYQVSTGGTNGYRSDIGHEVTGIDPNPNEDDLGELYVDDIPRESAAMPGAPSGKPRRSKRKRKGGRAAERRREREPDYDAEPEGPETTTALPDPDRSLGNSQASLPPPELTATSGTGTSGKLSYAAGVLQCVRGPEEGLSLPLIEGSYTIGRARENNFVLKDIAASREHLKIEVRDNIVRAVDCGSGNGTKVNGTRIDTLVLKNGDRIEIGNSVLTFTYLGRDRSLSLPSAPQDAVPATDRPPTQERIVMAAERLAAELSERFRREDDGLDEMQATSVERSLSGKAASSGNGSHKRPDSFVAEPSMQAALNDMMAEVSDPAQAMREAIPEESWADGETATRLPLGSEVASSRGYSDRALPPPAPMSGPSNAMQAGPTGLVPRAPATKSGSSAVMLVVAAMVVMLIAVGGIGAYLLLNTDQLDGVLARAGITSEGSEATGSAGEPGATPPESAQAASDPSPGAKKPAATSNGAAPASSGKTSDGKPAAATSVGDGNPTAKTTSDGKPAGTAAPASTTKDGKQPAEKPKATSGEGTKVATAGGTAKAAPDRSTKSAPAKSTTSSRKASSPEPSKPTKAQKAPTRTASRAPPPKAKPKPTPKRAVKPAPAPKRSSSSSAGDKIDDDKAKELYAKAIAALKSGDTRRACKFMAKVIQRAPSDSRWRQKAKDRSDRDCK